MQPQPTGNLAKKYRLITMLVCCLAATTAYARWNYIQHHTLVNFEQLKSALESGRLRSDDDYRGRPISFRGSVGGGSPNPMMVYFFNYYSIASNSQTLSPVRCRVFLSNKNWHDMFDAGFGTGGVDVVGTVRSVGCRRKIIIVDSEESMLGNTA